MVRRSQRKNHANRSSLAKVTHPYIFFSCAASRKVNNFFPRYEVIWNGQNDHIFASEPVSESVTCDFTAARWPKLSPKPYIFFHQDRSRSWWRIFLKKKKKNRSGIAKVNAVLRRRHTEIGDFFFAFFFQEFQFCTFSDVFFFYHRWVKGKKKILFWKIPSKIKNIHRLEVLREKITKIGAVLQKLHANTFFSVWCFWGVFPRVKNRGGGGLIKQVNSK